jgi:hypothetical protein
MLNAVARAFFARDIRFADAVVKAVFPMSVMRQPVPLRRRLRIEIVIHIIVNVVTAALNRVSQFLALEERRMRQLQFPIQREDLSVLHQPRCRRHALRRQQIQRSDLIVVAKNTPRRTRRIGGFDWQFIEGRQSLR